MTGDEDQQRINWPIALSAALVGGGACATGVLIASDRVDALSGLLVEIGGAIGLVAVLAYLERRLAARTRKSVEAAARGAVREVADQFEKRLVRLEELDEAQEQSREDRRRAANLASEAVLREALDATTLGTLLRGALESKLFADEEGLRVRTSESPDCPLLHILVLAFPNRSWVFLDFKPILFEGSTIDGVPMPQHSETIVLWDDEPAGEIAGMLEAALERLNVPPERFSFRFALERLVHSVDLMRRARAAPSGSPLRLDGRLIILINDEWAYTDVGLESTTSATTFPASSGWAEPPHWRSSSGRRHVFAVHVPKDALASADEPLREAIDWLRSRERLTIDSDMSDPRA